jgi:ATP-dependent protease ClpP protease subunit
LKQDLWLNSKKSLEYGFVDEIIKSTPPTKTEAST